jgi:hypothetical protein
MENERILRLLPLHRIILHFQINGISVEEMSAKEGLLLWAKKSKKNSSKKKKKKKKSKNEQTT